MKSSHELSDDEIALVARLLAKLEPGYLPQLLFDQINRLHVTSTVVVVPLRKTPAGMQVLLVQRGTGPTEPIWPGYWHLPGSMLRPTDHEGDYRDAFARILDGELEQIELSGEPTFLRTAFTQTLRGRELTQVYYAEVTGEPPTGKFFALHELPSRIIEHEKSYIQEAASAFENR